MGSGYLRALLRKKGTVPRGRGAVPFFVAKPLLERLAVHHLDSRAAHGDHLVGAAAAIDSSGGDLKLQVAVVVQVNCGRSMMQGPGRARPGRGGVVAAPPSATF